MGGMQNRRIPVVDGEGRLVGIVALGDLATDDTAEAAEALKHISEPSGAGPPGQPHPAPRRPDAGPSGALNAAPHESSLVGFGLPQAKQPLWMEWQIVQFKSEPSIVAFPPHYTYFYCFSATKRLSTNFRGCRVEA